MEPAPGLHGACQKASCFILPENMSDMYLMLILGCQGHSLGNLKGIDWPACKACLTLPDSRSPGELQAAEGMLGQLKGSLTYDEFKDVDLVVEAVIENLELKQKIFAGEPCRARP